MTDVRDEKDRPVPDVLGILPLRNAVVFPHAVVPLGAGRASSLRLIEEALAGSRLVGAVLQRDASDDAPGAAGLYTVGTVVVIHRSEEHTSELQSLAYLVCRLLLEKKKNIMTYLTMLVIMNRVHRK